ncbi:hypothetical protein PF008_g24397 [Phytophthora fragariae]|uniref:Uncharacterized protein n=1 Tax=Phytophthora fragariae TaxID=53985 RepID=A0A6G0QN01_9STRA|nr:hypothetical protein PF003_g11020 [Phytophthora fragariae]KAE9294958.1 hypothetical protein PF008_g24397 [Phytophthora fragariae]
MVIHYNNLVPISLYVSLDIIKVLQTNRITSDASMACEGTHAFARTSERRDRAGRVRLQRQDGHAHMQRDGVPISIDGVFFRFRYLV